MISKKINGWELIEPVFINWLESNVNWLEVKNTEIPQNKLNKIIFIRIPQKFAEWPELELIVANTEFPKSTTDKLLLPTVNDFQTAGVWNIKERKLLVTNRIYAGIDKHLKKPQITKGWILKEEKEKKEIELTYKAILEKYSKEKLIPEIKEEINENTEKADLTWLLDRCEETAQERDFRETIKLISNNERNKTNIINYWITQKTKPINLPENLEKKLAKNYYFRKYCHEKYTPSYNAKLTQEWARIAEYYIEHEEANGKKIRTLNIAIEQNGTIYNKKINVYDIGPFTDTSTKKYWLTIDIYKLLTTIIPKYEKAKWISHGKTIIAET